MPEIGRWNNLIFEVSPSVIRSFNDLQIKVGSDTDTVEDNGQQYTKQKNRKPIEVSLTVQLHAGLGYDVQSEANTFIQAALAGGVTNYFYVGSRKLVACPLMLTEATISRVMINAGGKWIEADVALTFKQASLLDGTIAPSTSGAGSSNENEGDKGGTTERMTAATASAVTAAMTGLNALIKNAKSASTAAKSGGGGTTRFAKTVVMVK